MKSWRPSLVAAAAGVAAFRVATQAIVVGTTMGFSAPARLVANPLSWVLPWVQFDARWYVAIAEVGYVRLSPVLGGTIPAGADVRLYGSGLYAYDGVAFPPLYPGLVRLTFALTSLHPAAAALLVGSLALLAALAAVHRLAEIDHGTAVARLTLLLLLVYPASLFLAAPYAEPLLLMALAWAFLSVRNDRWWLAGAFLAAATLTKVYAVLFVVALALEAVDGATRGAAVKRIAALATPPLLALAAWMAYLEWRFTDPLRFLTVQGYWHHRLAFPWTSMAYSFQTIYNDGRGLELGALALLAGMTWFASRHLRRSYTVAMLIALLGYTTTYNLVSVNRFVVALFPLFIAMAVLANRHRRLRLALPAACVPLAVFLLVGFVHGHWAG